jgi:hypothetical protein
MPQARCGRYFNRIPAAVTALSAQGVKQGFTMLIF